MAILYRQQKSFELSDQLRLKTEHDYDIYTKKFSELVKI